MDGNGAERVDVLNAVYSRGDDGLNVAEHRYLEFRNRVRVFPRRTMDSAATVQSAFLCHGGSTFTVRSSGNGKEGERLNFCGSWKAPNQRLFGFVFGPKSCSGPAVPRLFVVQFVYQSLCRCFGHL